MECDFYYHLLKPLRDGGGERNGISEETTRKCHILKPEISRPGRDSNTLSSIGDRYFPAKVKVLTAVSPIASFRVAKLEKEEG